MIEVGLAAAMQNRAVKREDARELEHVALSVAVANMRASGRADAA